MAQAGYTPISLYYSTTAAAVPTSGNLANGELGINIQDEKLYFKNAAGTVKLLASNATSAPVLTFSAGTTGFTPSTATSGAITLAGTLATTNGGTGLTAFTANQVFYASSTSAFAQSANLTFNGTTLTANTIGAFTLGGTIAGGGNQINNVIIGTTNPLAGAFTTLSASGLLSANANLKVVNGANDFGTIQLGTSASYVFTGGATYSGYRFEAPLGQQYDFQTGGTTRALINGTGLAVTGTLDATINTGGYGYVSTLRNSGGISVLQIIGTAAGPTTGGGSIAATGGGVLTLFAGSTVGSIGTSVADITTSGISVTGTLSSTLDATIYGVTVGRGAGAVASNTAVGAGALALNSTGLRSTAIGYFAGANSTNNYNVFVGSHAGQGNTGSFNTVLGDFALQTTSSSVHNTAIGQGALLITTGSYNTAIGSQALLNNASASNSTAVGYSALYLNTASNNTAVGYQALYTNGTLPEQTAVGYKAGFYSTGGYNTFVGHQAGLNQSTGDSNTYVGRGITGNAATGASTGSNNTAMGNFALAQLTNGANNTAIGAASLQANNSGTNNTTVGLNSLYSTTTGINNNALGVDAGKSLSTGSYNLFVGSRSGSTGAVALTGDSNSCIGEGSGYYLEGAANGNTFLGQNSGSAVTTGTNNVILGRYTGNSGGLDIRTASNYIVFADGSATVRGIFDNNGNLRINGIGAGGKVSVLASGVTESTYYAETSSATFTGSVFQSIVYKAANTDWKHFIGYASVGGTTNIIILGNGDLQNSNNSYGAISDAKLKENIVDASPKLDKLMQVRIRNYNLKGDYEQHKQLGVVAQELEQVFPGMVAETTDRDKEGNDLGTTTKSVKYSVFVPMLIKAIQEQQAIIESLKARLDAANL